MITKCRSCGAEIVWIETTKGKLQPFNREVDENGNRVFENGIAVEYQPLIHMGWDRYMPHHATCPDADKWRR